MDSKMFALRLAELRLNKGVSAREMSLSLGQSPGYINNIENSVSLPSMSSFFEICDYLQVSPEEFFSTDDHAPDKTKELLIAARHLRRESLEHLIALVKIMS
ncbi:MAG: helix-turn-helix transcriptional regulator [Lachnospiraceae bacterium]|nr:helix-turn-helix transcriptional regulator [Lachnospiraceae bacterium]